MRASTSTRRELLATRNELEADLSGEPNAVARNEEREADLAARSSRACCATWRTDVAAGVRAPPRALVRAAARPRARRAANERASPLAASPVAARVDLSEGAFGRGVRRDGSRARFRHRGDSQHPPRPRGPAAEEPARLCDRIRRPRDRPPHHPCAGRPLRLPGVPPRGGARAPLRGRRAGALVHVPQHLARPRADGDLLVHLRGGHARAGLACAPLRAVGRGGGGERRGDPVRRGPHVPPLRGEAPLRARLLGCVPVGAGEPRRATTSRCSPRRPASATTLGATSRTWTPPSTRPTTCAPGSARPSSRPTCVARSARTGGGAPRPGRSCAGCSPRARGPRPRRSHGRLGFDPLDTGPLTAELTGT